MIQNTSKHSIIPIFVALFIILSVLLIEYYSILPNPSTALEGKLNDIQKKSIDIFIDLSKLIITWSLGIVGGIAYFLKANLDNKFRITKSQLIFAELIILCSVLSIYFGHLSVNAVLNMLALDIFLIQDTSIVLYGILQYLFFLVSIILFGLYLHYTYWNRTNN